MTGAGPLKQQFLKEFDRFNQEAKKVQIQAKWLEIDDYPKMVASADLGICMHFSSSGLDLPMKVVDLFSCQVPVFAYDYPAITELVKPAKSGQPPNGALFKTADELKYLLFQHFSFGRESENQVANVEIYRKNLEAFTKETWDDAWQEVMVGSKKDD